jgi:hypothetical protein
LLIDFSPHDGKTARIQIRADPHIHLITNRTNKKFWLKTTGLPESCWRKPHIRKPLSEKRQTIYGTLHVVVHSVELKEQIMGMIEAFKNWI